MSKIVKTSPLRRSRTAAAGAALALAAFARAGLAADTQPAWQGIVTTTAATTAQCAGTGGGLPGDAEVSVFRPKIKTTDTNTFLSFVFLRAAFSLENTSEMTAHQMHGAGTADVFGVNGRGKFFEGIGTYSLTIAPAAIVATTPSITIVGKINNWFGVAGCSVTFRGVYGPRID